MSECHLGLESFTNPFSLRSLFFWISTRATSQWFANLDRIKGDAVKALEPVRFTPSSSRSRLESFVRGRSEWCISRQRVWGVPIPVLYDSATDEALLSEENINHITKVLEEKGTDYWWVGEAEEFVSPEYRNDSKSWKKGNDTVDVWFDSGTSWSMLDSAKPNEPNASTTNAKPLADVYFEGTDQHRGWFQSSLLTRIATSSSETSNPDQQSSSTSTSTSASSTPAAPFSNLLTHGFVVDRKGRKMAKSLGNGIDPLLIIKGGENKNKDPAFGADVLRLWAAKADYTGDTPIGPLIIKNTEDSLRKLRNTARFMLANLPKPEEVPELDQQELSLVSSLGSLSFYARTNRSESLLYQPSLMTFLLLSLSFSARSIPSPRTTWVGKELSSCL